MKAFLKGFVYAGRGVWFCIRSERNFRIHLAVAAYVLGFAPAFSLSRAEWAALLLTIALVIMAEAVNTAVEQTVDLLSPGSHPMARTAKDAAAGAVLVCAVTSVCAGIVLFGRPAALSALWNTMTGVWWKIPLLVFSLIPAFCFVAFGGEKRKEQGNDDLHKNKK